MRSYKLPIVDSHRLTCRCLPYQKSSHFLSGRSEIIDQAPSTQHTTSGLPEQHLLEEVGHNTDKPIDKGEISSCVAIPRLPSSPADQTLPDLSRKTTSLSSSCTITEGQSPTSHKRVDTPPGSTCENLSSFRSITSERETQSSRQLIGPSTRSFPGDRTSLTTPTAPDGTSSHSHPFSVQSVSGLHDTGVTPLLTQGNRSYLPIFLR